MKSTDQDEVAARAQAATADDVAATEPAEDAVLRDLSRALEAEPESASSYEALVTARARKGLKPPLDRKPVSMMTAAEVAATVNHYPGSNASYGSEPYQRYIRLQARKDELDDEIAAARVLARQGKAPDPSWKSAQGAAEDPRLAAWRSIAWERARTGLGPGNNFSLPEKCPSLARLADLEQAAEKMLKVLKALREHFEREAGI